MSSHGWASPEVRVAFERAAVVAKGLGNSVELAPPLVGQWLYHTSLGQFERAEAIGVELFEIARKNDSPDVLLQAHHAALAIPWLRGALPEANRHIEALLALYDEAKHDQHRYLYLGHDPAVCALSHGAIVQTLLGYPDRAAQMEDRALALARRLRHPPSLAHALWFVGEAQLTRRDREALAATAGELAALCEDQTLPSPRAAASMFNGWVMAHSGKISEGIPLVEQGLSAWQRMGHRRVLPRSHYLLAETYLAGGRYTEGLAQVSLALEAAEQTGVRYNDALIYRLRALFLVHVEEMNGNNVEADLKTAIQIAQAQTAKGLELPAAVSLAPLALSGEAAASPRTARSGLRVVHRRVRYARPQGGQGAAGGVGVTKAFARMSANGTKRTCRGHPAMSAFGGNTDIRGFMSARPSRRRRSPVPAFGPPWRSCAPARNHARPCRPPSPPRKR